MAERCINLNADEARAWAAGATALIRPAKPRQPWYLEDVLIGREAHVRTSVYECGTGNTVEEGAIYRADQPRFTTQWRSPVTMPKALARFRRRVASVRHCRVKDVEAHEWAEAGIDPFDSAFAPDGRCDPESWVSVTTTEACQCTGNPTT